MLVSDIISKARMSLSDESTPYRWSDDRLLSLLNDCLLDLARNTRLYSSVGWMRMTVGTAVYSISDSAVRIERVEYLGTKLDFMSFAEMDKKYGNDWVSEEGPTPLAIVHDLKRQAEFRVYPIPDNLTSTANVTSNSSYGIITSFNYQNFSFSIEDNYGDINPDDIAEYLTIYYLKNPTEHSATSETMDSVINDTMRKPIADYIAGQAFLDNKEDGDLRMGSALIRRYNDLKKELSKRKAVNDVQRVRTTPYNPLG